MVEIGEEGAPHLQEQYGRCEEELVAEQLDHDWIIMLLVGCRCLIFVSFLFGVLCVLAFVVVTAVLIK